MWICVWSVSYTHLDVYKRQPSILTPIFVVVEGVLEILIPTVMASLIDEGITGKSMPAIVKFGLILLACSLCSLAAGFLAGKFAAIAGAGFAKNLRHDEFEKVQGFSFTNIDKFSTGSIITRLTTDVTNLQNAYSMIIRLGVRALSLIHILPSLVLVAAGLAGIIVAASFFAQWNGDWRFWTVLVLSLIHI